MQLVRPTGYNHTSLGIESTERVWHPDTMPKLALLEAIVYDLMFAIRLYAAFKSP
jgi:hypothetical protein